MKLNCIHADTCLADYWGGHHLPHVAIPVHARMTCKDVREAIKAELRMGYVMGNSDDAQLLCGDVVLDEKRADKLTRAAYAAVNRDIKGKRYPFAHLELDSESQAYFVFIEA